MQNRYNLDRFANIRLDVSKHDKLQRMAYAEGCSVSDLIRRAVNKEFFMPDKGRDSSILARNGSN